MTIRLIGLAAGALFFVVGLIGRRRRGFTRADVAIWWLAGAVITILSLFPAAAGVLADLFRLENRLFAVLVASVGVLALFALHHRNRIRQLENRFGELVRNLAVQQFQREAGTRERKPTVAVVIAAYNEEDAIAGVLEDLPDDVMGYVIDPIVVVDGGIDDTAGVVDRAGYAVATHPVNRGQGDALRTGFMIALSRGDEIVVTMDADGQHRADQLPSLLAPIKDDAADYVQGSRFLGEYDDAGGAREIGIRFFARLVTFLSDAEITDSTNGFRAIRSTSLARLRLTEDRFSAPEILMEAAYEGLRIKEVPVHVKSRSHGESKKPKRLRYPLGYLSTVLSVWARH